MSSGMVKNRVQLLITKKASWSSEMGIYSTTDSSYLKRESTNSFKTNSTTDRLLWLKDTHVSSSGMTDKRAKLLEREAVSLLEWEFTSCSTVSTTSD